MYLLLGELSSALVNHALAAILCSLLLSLKSRPVMRRFSLLIKSL